MYKAIQLDIQQIICTSLTVFLLAILAACTDEYSEDSGQSTLIFNINWPETINKNSRFIRAISCVDARVQTIVAKIFDENDVLLAVGGPWDCSAHQGSLVGNFAGNDRRVSIEALESNGRTRYSGQVSGVAVSVGNTTNVGTINLSVVDWVERKPAPFARFGAASVVLNGKVYLIGGRPTLTSTTNSLDVYDPYTETWSTKSPMSVSRTGATASIVNGKIYVIGGLSGSRLNVVEEYDPITDSWVTKTPMPTARYSTASAVYNGKIYVFAGRLSGSGSFTGVIEVYDPVQDAWIVKNAAFSVARSNFTATVVNESIYLIGGYDVANTYNNTVVYDPNSDSFSAKSPLPVVMHSHTASNVNGKLYIIGGRQGNSASSAAFSTVYAYNPYADIWETKPAMNNVRGNHVAGVVDGRITVIGGRNGIETNAALIDSIEEYYPDTSGIGVEQNIWDSNASLASQIAGLTSSSLNGNAYLFGGTLDLSGALSNVERYHPLVDQWDPLASLTNEAYGAVSEEVNGKLYVFGGWNGSSIGQHVEAYDYTSDSWAAQAPMPSTRLLVTSSTVNGKVYLIGGTNENSTVFYNTVEMFDPRGDNWVTLSPISVPRYGATSSVVNGKIYVIGGYNGDYVSEVEEYDPIADSWTTVSTLPSPRYLLSSQTINGKIYVIAGDFGDVCRCSNIVNEFDPYNYGWLPKNSVPASHSSAASTVINGKIYLFGGRNGQSSLLNNVQVYQ